MAPLRILKAAIISASCFAATVLASERPAQAILTYYIFQSGSNTEVQAQGSLSIPTTSSGSDSCSGPRLVPSLAKLCINSGASLPTYKITGPSSFMGDFADADSTTGTIESILSGITENFSISSNYVSGSSIDGTLIFNNKTLSDLGITTTGLLGTWTLTGTGGGDTIQVIVGTPTPPVGASVPGPLPMFGAAAAFAHSRRLRHRLNRTSAVADPAGSIKA